MSSYTLFLLLHLLMAVVFVGAVFFEVLILEGARRHVSPRVMTAIEIGIGRRATRVMPWVILTLYGSGIAHIGADAQGLHAQRHKLGGGLLHFVW